MPPAILTGCSSLATLSLHGNPLTIEQLRETPGFAEFDKRRRAKYDKQVGLKGERGGGGFFRGRLKCRLEDASCAADEPAPAFARSLLAGVALSYQHRSALTSHPLQ